VLPLFRDFVFHQQSGTGAPALDVGHAVEALTRLDAGDSQRIALPCRDGQSMLTADYATVRASLDDSFGVLRARATAGKGPTGLHTAGWNRAGASNDGAPSDGGLSAGSRKLFEAAGAGDFSLGGG